MRLHLKKSLVILFLGLVGWALCGAIMFIGMSVTSIQVTLIIHVIGAPIIFWAISWIYFRKFKYTTPLQTAVTFLLIVVIVDFFLVALIINRSLEMFQSLLGTWIPFALIFIATYLTGLRVQAQETRSRKDEKP